MKRNRNVLASKENIDNYVTASLAAAAIEGAPNETIDSYSYGSYDAENNTYKLRACKTFREGSVTIGDDSNDDTGRRFYPNNGLTLIMPGKKDGDAIALRVRLGGETGRILEQTYIEDVFGTPKVTTRHDASVTSDQALSLDARSFGYIKVFKTVEDIDKLPPVNQEISAMFNPDTLTPEQQREFMLPANVIDVLERQPQSV